MYPVWASLARDYLAIMASSVSSERAFSSSGMTITKRRNRLTHDIVEALQILKAAIREDLLFRPEEPSKALELAILVEQSESQAQSSESQASEKWSNGDTPAVKIDIDNDDDISLGTESADGIHSIVVGSDDLFY